MSHIPLLKRSTLSNKINLMRQLNNATLVLEFCMHYKYYRNFSTLLKTVEQETYTKIIKKTSPCTYIRKWNSMSVNCYDS
jgi:hypothetical protein